MTQPSFSVVIPAHNEERVIARCLAAALDGAPADARFEVIVAANGCTDDTIEIARKAAPGAKLLDLPKSSKTAAINAGYEAATVRPIIILDADVICGYAALSTVAKILRDGKAMVAAPAMHVDTDKCDRWVKAYYRVWMSQPYVTDNLVGSGLYGLSGDAAARLLPLPTIIADDLYVRRTFEPQQRRSIAEDSAGRPISFTVFPPRTAIDHIRVEERRLRGNKELSELKGGQFNLASNKGADLAKAIGSGASIPDIAIYLAMKAAARLLYRIRRGRRGDRTVWTRDESARG